MDANTAFVRAQLIRRTAKALEANQMEVHIAQSASEVVPSLQALIPKGASVACGGSVTLEECGVNAHLRAGGYTFLDRDAPGADRDAMHHAAFGADWYLCSANAITQAGEVYQVDGNANRVAAIAFGPKNVCMVVGANKIVPDIAAAMQRRAALAGPANARRVGVATPCTKTGACCDCSSPARICCTELILRQQRVADRIKIILVEEDLGY